MKETFMDALAVMGVIGEKAMVVDGEGKTVASVSELLKAGGKKNGVAVAAALLFQTRKAVFGAEELVGPMTPLHAYEGLAAATLFRLSRLHLGFVDDGFGLAGAKAMSARSYNAKFHAALRLRGKRMHGIAKSECAALSILRSASKFVNDGDSVLDEARLRGDEDIFYPSGELASDYAMMLGGLDVPQSRSADVVKRWIDAARELARVYIDAGESAVPSVGELAA